MVSVNNNPGAIMALQTLRDTQTDLAVTQKRVNSGLKIADAKDGAAVYNMSNDLRNRLASQENIRDGISRATSVGDTALNAAQSVQKILIDMRDKATSAAQGALTSSQINAFNTEFQALRDQIAPLINAASFNGVNLVKDATTSFTIRLNDQDMTTIANNMTFTSVDLTATGMTTTVGNIATVSANVGAFTVLSTGVDTISNALMAAAVISGAISAVAGTIASLGSRLSALSKQNDFNAKLSDTLNKGISDLVDADLPAESAKLQALQTKQQLGVQVLSIANQAPQILLSLFR